MFGCLIPEFGTGTICETCLEKQGILSKIVVYTIVSKVCRQVYFVAGLYMWLTQTSNIAANTSFYIKLHSTETAIQVTL